MLVRIKNLLKGKAVYFAVFFTISIGILSLVKMPSNGIPGVASDKVLHTVAYFFLMIAWLYTFVKDLNFQKKLKYIVLACFASFFADFSVNIADLILIKFMK